MDIYKNNVKMLKKCMLEEIKKYDELEKLQVNQENVFEKDGILFFTDGENTRQIYSKNQEKEIEILTQNIDPKKENLIFVLGIGNIEFIKRLIQDKSGMSKIVIYEPNKYILKYISRLDVLGVEMETLALYANAMITKKRAIAMFTVTDNIILGKSVSSNKRQEGLKEMIELALDTAYEIEK